MDVSGNPTSASGMEAPHIFLESKQMMEEELWELVLTPAQKIVVIIIVLEIVSSRMDGMKDLHR